MLDDSPDSPDEGGVESFEDDSEEDEELDAAAFSIDLRSERKVLDDDFGFGFSSSSFFCNKF